MTVVGLVIFMIKPKIFHPEDQYSAKVCAGMLLAQSMIIACAFNRMNLCIDVYGYTQAHPLWHGVYVTAGWTSRIGEMILKQNKKSFSKLAANKTRDIMLKHQPCAKRQMNWQPRFRETSERFCSL